MNYPDPPQGVYSSTPIDMGLSPESYGQYPRSAHETYSSTMGYDASALYTEAPYMYTDDEIRVPSSNLSSGSASSTMGSPLSNPGQLAPTNDWAAPQGLGGSPSIVDPNDYFPTGTEYSFAPNMEGLNPHFDFAQVKAPGFVGELSQIPRSGLSSVASPSDSPRPVASEPGLSIDTRLAQAPMSPFSDPRASSRKSSVVFASPRTYASSPPLPAWSSPSLGDAGAIARNSKTAPLFSPFFSQSSGHFVAPLESSCWFSSVTFLAKLPRRCRDTQLTRFCLNRSFVDTPRDQPANVDARL